MDIILSCIAYAFHQWSQARTWAWIFIFPLCSSLIFPVRNMNSCRMRWLSEENGQRLLQFSPPSVPRLSSRPCHTIPVPTPQTSGHKIDRTEVTWPPVTLQVRDGGQKWQGHKNSSQVLP